MSAFICGVVWLAMGGWAFSRLDHGPHIVAGAFWCIALAPFAFGVACGEIGKKK